MTNPYRSPPELPQASFFRRLRRALGLAITEYRLGLERDNFTLLNTIHAWASMVALVIFVVIILLVVLLLFLNRLGVL